MLSNYAYLCGERIYIPFLTKPSKKYLSNIDGLIMIFIALLQSKSSTTELREVALHLSVSYEIQSRINSLYML